MKNNKLIIFDTILSIILYIIYNFFSQVSILIIFIIYKEQIFRFLHIFIGFIQDYKDEKCGQFIHHRVHRKKCILHIKSYFVH